MSLETTIPDDGRPTRPLPVRQLIRLSLYWLGLSSIFAGLNVILTGQSVDIAQGVDARKAKGKKTSKQGAGD